MSRGLGDVYKRQVLADAGYQGWLLVEAEQDPAKANPLEYAITGRTYIREHTGL